MELPFEKYQQEAVEFGLTRGCCGFFLDPGLGKTAISLSIFKYLREANQIKAMVVIAPLRPCYLVWPKEVEKWDDFKGMKVVVLHGPKKQELLHKKADIYVVNPDGLKWFADNIQILRKTVGGDIMLTVDESSKFKHTNTQRYKILKPLLQLFPRRMILTGSPAASGLLDLFGQVFIMDRGATFGPYITKYREKYFYPSGYGGYDWQPQIGAEDRIYAALAPKVLRMSEEDYLKLPPAKFNDVLVDLPEDCRKIYRDMEKALRAEVEGELVGAANAGIASSKCRQIAGGGIYMEDGTMRHLHMVKAEAIRDIVEELQGQPVLIGYEFDHELERLREVFGKDVPYMAGGVSPKKTIELEKAWNAGEIPVFLGQNQAVALGLNLQESGHTVIFHTLPWSYETYDQFIRRLRRKGQKKRVIVHRIITMNTTDEAQILGLGASQHTQDALFQALKTYWRKQDETDKGRVLRSHGKTS